MLLRELHDQIAKTNSEQCLEENISHFEPTKSEIGEETTQPESLPLCHDSFQIIKEEWHPDNLLETTPESHILNNCHKNHEELFRTEIDQEKQEKPQSSPANSNADPLEEAHEDRCTFVQRKKTIPSLLTEEEIDLILNRQPTSKPPFEQYTSTHLLTEPCCLESENTVIEKLK